MTKRLLNNDDILKLARLAQLSLSDEEREEYRKQLEESLGYIANLNELQVEKLSKALNVSRLNNIDREDVVDHKRSLTRETAQQNALNKNGDYFVVKRIL